MEQSGNGSKTATAAAVASAVTDPTSRVSVLAIDDNEEFHGILKQSLAPHGYDVRTIANPVKALEIYKREKDAYQLVLLDYYMPGLDGGKTFEWLRKFNPDVKVIICSGADELRLRQIQAQHPINGYIHKPFRLDEALFVMRQVLTRPVRRA
jgi:two-component system cell cycle sensor histidine kinase/response regulator CckA